MIGTFMSVTTAIHSHLTCSSEASYLSCSWVQVPLKPQDLFLGFLLKLFHFNSLSAVHIYDNRGKLVILP